MNPTSWVEVLEAWLASPRWARAARDRHRGSPLSSAMIHIDAALKPLVQLAAEVVSQRPARARRCVRDRSPGGTVAGVSQQVPLGQEQAARDRVLLRRCRGRDRQHRATAAANAR